MTFAKIAPTALAVVLASGAAFAADLPRRTAPPAFIAPPVFTWTGFYIGVNAGYAFGDQNSNRLTPNFGAALNAGFPAIGRGRSNDGFTGGGQIGYNFQYGNNFLVGFETDINYLSNGGNRRSTGYFLGAPFAAGSTLVVNDSRSGDGYLGTVRGRLGYTFDRTLLYVTGGLAYGELGSQRNGTATFFAPNGAQGATFTQGGGSDTRVGYALGAGLEYAFTQNWTAKVEYIYADLGGDKRRIYTDLTGANPNFNFIASKQSSSTNIVRVGLNYKF